MTRMMVLDEDQEQMELFNRVPFGVSSILLPKLKAILWPRLYAIGLLNAVLIIIQR
jgi:hypothetical protein